MSIRPGLRAHAADTDSGPSRKRDLYSRRVVSPLDLMVHHLDRRRSLAFPAHPHGLAPLPAPPSRASTGRSCRSTRRPAWPWSPQLRSPAVRRLAHPSQDVLPDTHRSSRPSTVPSSRALGSSSTGHRSTWLRPHQTDSRSDTVASTPGQPLGCPSGPWSHPGPSRSVLVVLLHLDGLLRVSSAGLLHPAAGPGVHHVSSAKADPSQCVRTLRSLTCRQPFTVTALRGAEAPGECVHPRQCLPGVQSSPGDCPTTDSEEPAVSTTEPIRGGPLLLRGHAVVRRSAPEGASASHPAGPRPGERSA